MLLKYVLNFFFFLQTAVLPFKSVEKRIKYFLEMGKAWI